MRQLVRRVLRHPTFIGVLGGIAGVLLTVLVWHLWLDHQLLHQMVGVMNQQLQKYPLK